MEVLLSKGLKEEVNYVKDVIKNYANKKEKLILLMLERYHDEWL